DDVGEVLCGGPCPDVAGGPPPLPEVVPLDEHVGRHDEPAIRGGDDGGVVARGHEGRAAARQERGEPGDQLSLGEVGDGAGRVRGAGHGPTLPAAGTASAGRTGPAPLRQGVRGRCLSGGAYGAGARRRSGAGGHDGAGYRGAVRRRVGGALVAVAVLGGCASSVTVAPGPHAADPVRGGAPQLVPGELAGREEPP